MSGLHTPLSERDLELLSAHLDGVLAHPEGQALEERLAREESLRAALEDLRATRQLLRSLPPLKAPRNFTLDPSAYGRRTSRPARVPALANTLQLAGALGAAASVLLVATGLLLGATGPARTPAPLTDPRPALEIAVQPTDAVPPLTATPTVAAEAPGEGAPPALATVPLGTPTPPASPPPEIALEAAAEFAAPAPDESPAMPGAEAPAGHAAAPAPDLQEAPPGILAVPPGDADGEAFAESMLRDAAQAPLAAPAQEKLEAQPSPTAPPTQPVPATDEARHDDGAEAEAAVPPADDGTGRAFVLVGLGALAGSTVLFLVGRHRARRP
jgi:hypothetical protein